MSLIPKKPQSYKVPPFDQLTLVIFGSPGSGKTWFCGGDKSTLFLSTEPGTNYTTCPTVELKDWSMFIDVIKEFVDKKKAIAAGQLDPEECPYTSFTIDIVDTLIGFCRDDVCRRKGLAYPPTNDFGKTWSEVTNEWKKWIGLLMRIGPVRFITHMSKVSNTISAENGLNVEVETSSPTFSGSKASQFLDGIICAMGYCAINKAGQHVITFKKTAEINAKDRTNILCKCGVMPNDWRSVSARYEDMAKKEGLEIRR